MTFFDYGETDFIMCEMCQQDRAVDIHHLNSRGMGGSSCKDHIENLMGLCRDCHIKCESDSMFNCFAKIKHLELVCQQIYYQIEYNKKYENRINKNK